MDPAIHSDTPAKDSMGMDFVPVYADEAQAGSLRRRPLGTHPLAGAAPAARRAQRAAVRAPLSHTIRTVGRVAVDERRLHHVHVKYDGYVEHLYVDFTGKFVKHGDALLSIYSPDLVATQQEYLLALRAQRELQRSGSPAVAAGRPGAPGGGAAAPLASGTSVPRTSSELETTGDVMRALDIHAEHRRLRRPEERLPRACA